MLKISTISNWQDSGFLGFLAYQDSNLDNHFSKAELAFIQKGIENKQKQIVLETFPKFKVVQLLEKKDDQDKALENSRKEACKLFSLINPYKPENLCLVNLAIDKDVLIAYSEGLALSSYQFLKYFKDVDEKRNSLKEITVYDEKISNDDLLELIHVVDAVFRTKDLVNEPLSFLTATQLASEIKVLGQEAGFSVEVFDKGKIKALKMGGLLAVNKGSVDPPTFSILEWKPENPVNDKPFVLVGKGIVYDTGGLSLKPTPNSMDHMKCDMAGAAAVVGAFYAIAKNKLPVYVVGLVPASDNRPDGNAYAPGDVITMHDGQTVEVLNTDAEGRMILADALSYAKKYDPEFVADVATLTGSAMVAIGFEALVGMCNDKGKEYFDLFVKSGFHVHERIVEFPLWDEYDEMLKSDIADMKNIGGREAGAITAGKFLQRFVDYPWAHFDIAGPSYNLKADSYRGKGASAYTVRLFYDFFRRIGMEQ